MALFRIIGFAFALLSVAIPAHAQTTAEKYGTMAETWDAQISPDGKHLALGCSPTGVRAICLYQLDSDARPRLIAPPDDGRIESVSWASGQYLLYTVEVFDKVGTSSGLLDVNIRRLAAYDLKKSKSAMLMRNVGGFASITDVDSLLTDEPDRIMMNLSFRGDDRRVTGSRLDRGSVMGQHIIYRVNLKDGKGRKSSSFASEVLDSVHDAKGNRLAEIERDFKQRTFKVFSTVGDRQLVFERANVQLPPFYIDGLSEDKQSLIVNFDDGERFGLYTLSLIDGTIAPVLYRSSPVGYVLTIDDPFTNEVIGYSYAGDLPGNVYLNETFAETQAFTRNALKADRVILESWSNDLSQFTLAAHNRGQPVQYYIYDKNVPSISPIGGEAPWIATSDLGQVETVTYAASDGLEIEAFLTYPNGKSKADGPLPLVTLPHGGPEARDRATYDWLAQAVASQGYLVMQPNFRGSAGYGAEFRNAGYGEFGGKMIDDITDGAAWAVAQGLAKPGYCSVGWSYGEYAALMTGLKDASNAGCLVSINGVTDVGMVFDDGDSRSSSFAYWENYVGDFFKTERSERRMISPAPRGSEYRVPVLLLHGDEDTTVPVGQSKALYSALSNSADPRLIVFDGDDHQLARTTSRVKVPEETLAFLQEHHPAR
ncbi:MAG: prolyl oligopeptidase family serine peptidase [Pseudomonadota bacterium]